MTTIVCRAVIEVLGKPQEHVKNSLQSYLEKIKNDETYLVKSVETSKVKKQEEAELWANFAEIEFSTAKVENILSFCFDYMPAIIEIVEPSELKFADSEVSHFLNDL